MRQLNQRPEWIALQQHWQQMAPQHMRDLFIADPQRYQNFSLSTPSITLDYSKNCITQETRDLLIQLAMACELPQHINTLFAGEFYNHSAQCFVHHPWLRYYPDTLDTHAKQIIAVMHERMFTVAEQIMDGTRISYNGQLFTDVVNIGIGGSDLGARLTTTALQPYAHTDIKLHFLSNIDGQSIKVLMQQLDLTRTLFIVASKSFNTTETLMNANMLRQYFPPAALSKHFIAITANPDKAREFGIAAENTLTFPNWVNGRFSIWSAIGLALMIAIGKNQFQEFLAGAHDMDTHFHQAPFDKNMPVILALLSLWYTNFFNAQSQAILPYDDALRDLPAYLQQAHMESYGKSIQATGQQLDYATGPLIWGGTGTDGQHAYYQLLHQGTHVIPVDFIIARYGKNMLEHHRRLLFANCLSQSRALMLGQTQDDCSKQLNRYSSTREYIDMLAPQQATPGNRPSNTLVLHEISPYALGKLLALYEHKIFTLSVLWNINAFDQWGIELGKNIARELYALLRGTVTTAETDWDSSTLGLTALYEEMK